MRTIFSFIYIFVAFFCINNIFAQDKNTTQLEIIAQIDSLSSKLNSLQHDYDYLYCNYMLSDIQLNIKGFSNELSTKSNAIIINCYNSRFDIDLYSAYKEYYMQSIELYDSMKQKAEVITAQ